jgi:hypothetical protein
MTDRTYQRDFFGDEELRELVVSESGRLPSHRGSIHVEGAQVTLDGGHTGSLWLWDGAELHLTGTHTGSLHVEDGCTARITGTQTGSTHVAANASVKLEAGSAAGSVRVAEGGEFVVGRGARHAGSVRYDGRYILEGDRGGSYEGNGEYDERPGSRVHQPVFRNGATVYQW